MREKEVGREIKERKEGGGREGMREKEVGRKFKKEERGEGGNEGEGGREKI